MAHGTPRGPRDIAQHSALRFSVEPAAWTLRRPPHGQTQVAPRAVVLEANSYTMLREGCLEGLGIARLPAFMVDEERGLERVLSKWSFAETPIHALYASERAMPRRVRALLDVIQTELE